LRRLIIAALVIAGLFFAGRWLFRQWYFGGSDSNVFIRRWLTNPAANPELSTKGLTQCEGAPFIIPSQGFIGLLWRDTAGPYNALRRHTGIDIFGVGEPGSVPIYAAYDGWLTRLDDWRSTVIIRHDDPLQEGRTIWTYYTHMASRSGQSFIVDAFPPGTFAKPITQGTLLGFQGEYNPQFPVAMHLHFSIVTSEPDGSFKNEAVLENTLDPTRYLGMQVNIDNEPSRPPRCL